MDDSTLLTLPFAEAYKGFQELLNTACGNLEALEDQLSQLPRLNASQRHFLVNLRDKGLDKRSTWLAFSLSFRVLEDHREEVRSVYDQNNALRKYSEQTHLSEGNRRQQCMITFLYKLFNRKVLLQEVKECYLCLGHLMELLTDEKSITTIHEHFLREIDDWL